jgi:uncharacterized phosphosugar-binding protein
VTVIFSDANFWFLFSARSSGSYSLFCLQADVMVALKGMKKNGRVVPVFPVSNVTVCEQFHSHTTQKHVTHVTHK